MPTVPWKRAFEECQALVMTPAQLVKCLTHARVAIADVALLVLDEIHRLRGDDLYATIMSYWYARTSAHARPRVLGLSASPVDESEKNEPTEEGVEEKLSLLERRIDALAWSRRPKFGQLEKEIVLYEVTPDVVAVSLVAELLTECKPGAEEAAAAAFSELHTGWRSCEEKVRHVAAELGARPCLSAVRMLADDLAKRRPEDARAWFVSEREARERPAVALAPARRTQAQRSELFRLVSENLTARCAKLESGLCGCSAKVNRLVETLKQKAAAGGAKKV